MGATLFQADLYGANLSGVDLRDADLERATLIGANFEGANLSGSNLNGALVIRTNLNSADFVGAEVYGASVWDIKTNKETKQSGLKLTNEITVDDLEVAQFIYLLLNNRAIRNIINTITSKAVLILGRFTEERKKVLRTIDEELRKKHNMVPILFDFPPSPTRDLTETIQLLASMCRFVVADLTDAKSIPQELSHIIPNFPSVPVRPLILSSQNEYGMFEHWRKYTNVLPEYLYDDGDQLIYNFEKAIIDPIKKWEETIDKKAAREKYLLDENDKLMKENAEKLLKIAELEEKLMNKS